MWKDQSIKWTIFCGSRVDVNAEKQCHSEEKNSTMVELCEYLINSGGLPDSMSFVKPSQSMEDEDSTQ